MKNLFNGVWDFIKKLGAGEAIPLIATISLWLILLLLILIYLIIRRYLKYRDQINGKVTRAAKIARFTTMTRVAKAGNFFERVIDKAALNLVSKKMFK